MIFGAFLKCNSLYVFSTLNFNSYGLQKNELFLMTQTCCNFPFPADFNPEYNKKLKIFVAALKYVSKLEISIQTNKRT